MEERIKKVMSDVFLVDISSINDYSSPDSVDKWDSIGHLNLTTALEEEFEISISEDQMLEMLNFKLIREIINECVQMKKQLN
jgi:acyl carrier protein